MYTNRIDTAGNPIYDFNVDEVNSFEIRFCPHCRAMNYINLSRWGRIEGLILCDKCGGEL